MSKLLQLRGGTTAEHATFTGALREVTVDTTKDTLVVHDGATAGGFPLLSDADIGVTVLSPTGDGSGLTGISSTLTVVVVTTTALTAAAGNHYILTNVAATTLTLPAAPSSGDTVMVSAQNGLATNIIARNSQLLQVDAAGAGLAEDMTYDLPKVTLTLKFSNNIWRLI
jgi:hypothetical protein